MKKSLLTISALTIIASASPAFAGQYNNSYGNSYNYTPAYNNPYAQNSAPTYNQPYNQAAAYNNMQPASGHPASNSNSSRWPYWYVGLNAGMNFSTADDWNRGASKGSLGTDDTIGYSATIGYQPSNLRYEIEAGIANPDTTKGGTNGDITASKLMANAIYELSSNYSAKPFLGAGLGVVRTNVDATNTAGIAGSDTQPAYQLIGGVSFAEVIPQTDLSLAYKYLGAFSDFEIGTTEFEYNAHSLEAGARFRF